jgi:hypothetical protein
MEIYSQDVMCCQTPDKFVCSGQAERKIEPELNAHGYVEENQLDQLQEALSAHGPGWW